MRKTYVFSAPGRTEISGNHTDHQQGCVLAAAVDLETVAEVTLNDSDFILVQSEGYPLVLVDLKDLSVHEEEKNTTVSYEVVEYNEWDSDYKEDVVKSLRLGVSICNPTDTFNERAGKEKAVHRAKNSKKNALYSTEKGYISSRVVRAVLEQEAHYVKTNPGKYIKGYNEAEVKYKFEQECKTKYSELSESEKSLVKSIKDIDLQKLEEYKKLAKYA